MEKPLTYDEKQCLVMNLEAISRDMGSVANRIIMGEFEPTAEHVKNYIETLSDAQHNLRFLLKI